MTNHTHAEAVANDTALVEASKIADRCLRDLDISQAELRRRAGQSCDWKTRQWTGSLEDAVRALGGSGDAIEEAIARRKALDDANARVKHYNDVWRYGGQWSRFYLVLNNNGHIHRATDCPTCFIDTQFAFLPELSGMSESEAVVAQGEILCSICFPSAPVEWTCGESKASRAAKDVRAAASAKRFAEKMAKQLLPDGSALVVKVGRWDEKVTTTAAAKSLLTDIFEPWRQYSPENDNAVRVLSQAIAARQGTTPEVEIEAARKRAAKRR